MILLDIQISCPVFSRLTLSSTISNSPAWLYCELFAPELHIQGKSNLST